MKKFKLLRYLKFLLSSTNQHGVHSPFIYNYVTKGLYTRVKHGGSKTFGVLLKSIAYFNLKNVWLPKDQKVINRRIVAHFPSIQINKGPYDLIFIDISDSEAEFPLISNNSHNETLLIVDSINENKGYQRLWEKIKNQEKVTVTVDMYHCGAVFFRKEQAKEHFKIRI